MKNIVSHIFILLLGVLLLSCSRQDQSDSETSMRGLADTVGYAYLNWQMDSVMARINALNQDDLGMGRTDIAAPHHWAGYTAIGFK